MFKNLFVYIFFGIIFPYTLVSQCTSCTIIITGSDASTYTLFAGDKICLAASADFTGSIRLYGGAVENCAIAPQSFSIDFNSSFPNGTIVNNGTMILPAWWSLLESSFFDNYGTLNVSGGLNIQDASILSNYGTINCGTFSTLDTSVLDNFGDIVSTGNCTVNTSTFWNNYNDGTISVNNLSVNGTVYNSGEITLANHLTINTAVWINDGGCATCIDFIHRGEMTGITCGTITASGITNINNSSAEINGNIAIVDLSPSGSDPYVDINLGTIAPSVTSTSCGCPGALMTEDCSNGLDDDGDGYTDGNDPDCIVDGSCGCPVGSTVITSIPFGYNVPAGESHCLDADVVLNSPWNNFSINGNFYITNGSNLEILNGLIHIGADANIIICDDASFTYLSPTGSFVGSIYNFGWLELCASDLTVNNFILGQNSVTSLKGDDIEIDGDLIYNGAAGGNSYMHIAPSNTLNSSTGTVPLNGSAEIVVKIDHPTIIPTGVTNCNGCAELSGITGTCNDGSVETTYTPLQTTSLEICGNLIDDNGDGRIDEGYPASIEDNLILWLKADIGFGSAIWADQSPFGNDAVIHGDPSLVLNSLNFNNGIHFDGNDHVEVNLPELVFESGNHHIAVFAVYAPANNSTELGVYGNQASGIYNLTLFDGQIGNGASLGNSVPDLYGDWPHIASIIIDEEDNVSGASNSSRAYSNGTQILSFSFDENLISGVNSIFHIGKSGSNGVSQFFTGDIQEFIIYYEDDGNSSISELERRKIESYLAVKYGVVLSVDYISSQ